MADTKFAYVNDVTCKSRIVQNHFHKTAEFQDILPWLTLEK